MLTTLRIKNLALVADLTLELAPGYNAITGETGAGKSIIIGALNLVLGQRADRTLIRSGEDSCSVEAVFEVGVQASAYSGTLAEDEIERADDDGFARAGFAGDGVIAGRKFERKVGDQGEIFDAQRGEHGIRLAENLAVGARRGKRKMMWRKFIRRVLKMKMTALCAFRRMIINLDKAK